MADQDWTEQAKRPFVQVKDHVLLPYATELETVDAEFKGTLTPDRVEAIVALLPDDWLTDPSSDDSPEERRQRYAQFLVDRIAHSDIFVQEAQNARAALV